MSSAATDSRETNRHRTEVGESAFMENEGD